MSEQAKAIIDGKIKVLTPTENLEEIFHPILTIEYKTQ